MSLKALVTGASRGIGAEIAKQLFEKDYSLALLARNKEQLNAFKATHKRKGVEVLTHACDLSKTNDIEGATIALKHHWDTLDVLVLNAGVFLSGELLTENEDQLIQQWNLNVLANYRLVRQMLPLLKANGKGHIFLIGSIAGLAPRANAGSYTVTKYALHGFAAALREELRDLNVKVTLIVPGATLTSSWDGSGIPVENFVQPADVASAIVNALAMSSAAVVETLVINPVKPF